MSSHRMSSRPSATPVSSRPRPTATATPASTRRRQREARSASSSPERQTRRTIRRLPDYVPPSAPLNVAAITALENSNSHSDYVRKLKDAQAKSLGYVREASASLYDRATSRQLFYDRAKTQLEDLEKQQDSKKSQTQDAPGGTQEQDPGALQEKIHMQRIKTKQRKDMAADLKKQADAAYGKLEPKFRELLDGKARMEEHERILSEVTGNVQRGEGRVAPTQSTLGASQFRRTQDNAEEDGDTKMTQDMPRGVGVLESVKAKSNQSKAAYERLNMRQRYAENNDYVEFKQVIHDSIHQDDGTLLPHANTWFQHLDGESDDIQNTDPTSNMPGAFTQGDDEDMGSDIEIARERISTKCPVSLVEMTDPVTTPCNHNFENDALVAMIRQSTTWTGGTQESRGRRTVTVGAQQTIRCPVPSCSHVFGERDLRKDVAMRRKIKRLQDEARREERAAEEEDEDEDEADSGNRRRPVMLTMDTPDSRRQSRAPASSAIRVKREMGSSMAPRSSVAPQQQRVASTPADTSIMLDDDEDEDMDDSYRD